MTAPDGTRYLVRALRNLPLRGSPLGLVDNIVPQHVSLAAMIGANLYSPGQMGWDLQVLRAETAWRASRVVYSRKLRDASQVAEAAMVLAVDLQRGAEPWVDDGVRSTWESVKKVMKWAG